MSDDTINSMWEALAARIEADGGVLHRSSFEDVAKRFVVGGMGRQSALPYREPPSIPHKDDKDKSSLSFYYEESLARAKFIQAEFLQAQVEEARRRRERDTAIANRVPSIKDSMRALDQAYAELRRRYVTGPTVGGIPCGEKDWSLLTDPAGPYNP